MASTALPGSISHLPSVQVMSNTLTSPSSVKAIGLGQNVASLPALATKVVTPALCMASMSSALLPEGVAAAAALVMSMPGIGVGAVCGRTDEFCTQAASPSPVPSPAIAKNLRRDMGLRRSCEFAVIESSPVLNQSKYGWPYSGLSGAGWAETKVSQFG